MYKCRRCHEGFINPTRKERSLLSILVLTIKAIGHPEISTKDCYVDACPNCGSTDIYRCPAEDFSDSG